MELLDHVEHQGLFRVSASQLEKMEKCPRLWFLEDLCGLKPPETAWRGRGKVLHAFVELYLHTGRFSMTEDELDAMTRDVLPAEILDGTAPTEVQVKALEVFEAACAQAPYLVRKAVDKGHLPAWPVPGGVQVENKILEQVTTEAFLLGYIDLWYEDADGFVNLEDHKTTSSLDYAKTPVELLENLQLNIYGHHLMGLAPGIPLRFRHNYYCTKNKKKVDTMQVSVVPSAESIQKVWDERVVPLTEQIVQLRKSRPHKDAPDWTPPTEAEIMAVEGRGALNDHCQAYGGCPHRKTCGIPEKPAGFAGFRGDPAMGQSLIEKLKAKAQADAAGTPAPAPPVTPAPVTPAPVTPAPVRHTVMGVKPSILVALEKIDAMGQGRPALGIPATAVYAAATGLPFNGGGTTGSGDLGGIVLNTVADVLKFAGMPVETPAPAPAPATPPPITATPPDAAPAVEPPVAEILAELAAETDAVPAEIPAETTKPQRAKGKAKPPEDVATLQEAVTDLREIVKTKDVEIAQLDALVTRLQSVVPATLAPASAAKGFKLLVDCLPMRGTRPVYYEDWIAPVIKLASEMTGHPDFALLDYKGTPTFIVCLRDYVGKNPLPAEMYASSKSRTWNLASEVLVPLATEIVKPAY